MGGAWASSVVCSCSQPGSTRPRTFSIATMVEKADVGSATYVPTEKVLPKISTLTIYPEDVDFGTEDVDAPKPGYIYVIQELVNGRATGFYKVGRTGNPNKRLADLQTGNVRPLDFTRRVIVTDVYRAEAAAHKALATYSVTYGGGTEWFRANAQQEGAFYRSFDLAVARYE